MRMINVLFSRICILICGVLYPGYLSFKSLSAKSGVNDYVKWMRYWIVFAIFTVSETFADIFLTWFPFYYELKIMLMLWLSPAIGNGSTFMYQNCVHPLLKKHETRLDYLLGQAILKGQDLLLYSIRKIAIYIVNSIMKVTIQYFPHGIFGLLSRDDVYVCAAPIQEPSAVVSEEEETQEIFQKTVHLSTDQKTLSAKYRELDAPYVTRARSRKVLQTKPDIDYNLNQR